MTSMKLSEIYSIPVRLGDVRGWYSSCVV